jgi:hypothetical protein
MTTGKTYKSVAAQASTSYSRRRLHPRPLECFPSSASCWPPSLLLAPVGLSLRLLSVPPALLVRDKTRDAGVCGLRQRFIVVAVRMNETLSLRVCDKTRHFYRCRTNERILCAGQDERMVTRFGWPDFNPAWLDVQQQAALSERQWPSSEAISSPGRDARWSLTAPPVWHGICASTQQRDKSREPLVIQSTCRKARTSSQRQCFYR